MKELTFTNLAVLATLDWEIRRHVRPPVVYSLLPQSGSLINEWLTEHGVDPWHMMPVTSQQRTKDIIDDLWDAGLLREDRSLVRPSKAGYRLLEQMGDWRNWPERFVIDSQGRAILETAVYF